MLSKTLCLLFLAMTLNAPLALAKDRIRISIKNDYDVALNFGLLGKGTRNGTDTADGVLELQAGEYKGIVTAWVTSTQTMTGLGGVGSCGPGSYRNSQELQVVGHLVGGFNPNVQSVTFNPAANTEYLSLEFVPSPGAELQPPNPNPGQDQVIDCHTIIETEAGRFLPLNDSRWTMQDGGYTIALPASGTINYTDDTVAAGGNVPIGPFKAKKSLWTIQVERLP